MAAVAQLARNRRGVAAAPAEEVVEQLKQPFRYQPYNNGRRRNT